MFSLKKLSLAKVEEKPEVNGVTKEIADVHDKELPPTPIEKVPPSPKELEYCVPPDNESNRSVAPSVDSLGANSSPFDQFETVVEVAELPENISDTIELGGFSQLTCWYSLALSFDSFV
ncbi:unnamed protein product [Strongylus vulgaris]|uniref:Uncharacterized protein n=1 Tax=Strongylus vulgaris TaxID=40348 RepID=A0A3P7JJU5_STRVU|nr:unnamed protein product [Strongylus vulgaris]